MGTVEVKKKMRNDPMFLKLFAIAMFTPVLTSLGFEAKDIDTWSDMINVLASIVLNPFLLGTTVFAILMFFKSDDVKEEENKGGEE